MAHWVKAPAVEPDVLNLISWTPVEGDRHWKIVLFPPHVCIHVHIAYADKYSKNFKLSDFEVVSKLLKVFSSPLLFPTPFLSFSSVFSHLGGSVD